jgi:multidrug efflux system membrane fusion protein
MQSRLPAHNSQKRWMLLGGLGMLVVAIGLFLYFGAEIRANERKAPKGPPAIPVTVAPVRQEMVPFRLLAIGNVEAYATVSVKARVDGQIVEVGFKEGESVPRNRVLFNIDPRPYAAALRQAEANFLRDTAQKDQARSQEQRYKDLLEKNFVSKEAYAQIRTNADTAEAVAQGSRAALDNAKLNVEYCTIRSPIEGYAGKIQIQLGNLVRASDPLALVVINQVHPIYVNFSVPEQDLLAVRGYMSSGPLAVQALAPGSDKPAASGTLVFVDNAVDPSTGTIKLRAQFKNSENALWPGQFVNIRITLYDQKDALVVPSRSVQTGPAGQYVFVVKPDMTTELRKITVARTEGDNAVIASGLQKGEQVVTQGQLRLGAGAKVLVKS